MWVGPPGCGKTQACLDMSGLLENTENVYFKPRGPWWDGYVGQLSVISDDFFGWFQ